MVSISLSISILSAIICCVFFIISLILPPFRYAVSNTFAKLCISSTPLRSPKFISSFSISKLLFIPSIITLSSFIIDSSSPYISCKSSYAEINAPVTFCPLLNEVDTESNKSLNCIFKTFFFFSINCSLRTGIKSFTAALPTTTIITTSRT